MKPILTTVKFALALTAALTAGAQRLALPAGTYHLTVSPGAQTDSPFQPGVQPEGQSTADTKDDLFAGTSIFAKGATDVTEISMDPDSLGMVKGKDGARAHNTILSVVHTYSYDKPGMYRMEDVEAYRKKLEGGSWVCPIHVHSNTGSTDICSRTGENETNEMVILAAEPRELTFIHMSGKMSLGELNEMSGRAAPMVLPAPPLPKVKVSPPSPPASTETAPH